MNASGMPVRDPTAPYYGGAAPSGARVGARDAAARVRPGGPEGALEEGAVGRDREAAGSAEGLGRPKSPNVPERSGRGERRAWPKGQGRSEPWGCRKAPKKLDLSRSASHAPRPF